MLKDNETQGQSAADKAGLGEQPVQQQSQSRNQRQPMDAHKSLMGVDNRLRRRFGRSTAGEAVTQYADAMRAIMKRDGGEDAPYRILTLDSNQRMTALSAVVVVLPETNQGRNLVASHTLLVEASAGRLQPIRQDVQGRTIELAATPGDTYDATMMARVEDAVKEVFPGHTHVSAGANVIPREVEAADEATMYNLLYNATAALDTTLDTQFGGLEEPFNLGWIDQADILIANLDYSPQPLETAAGLPVRSDVSVQLGVTRPSQGNSIHSNSRELARVDAYVELVYTPPGPPAYGQQPVTQHFTPRIVLTNVETQANAVTPELQLFSLITSTLLTQNMAWAGVYRPRAGAGKVNLRNIGALGLEMPGLVDTKDGKPAMIDVQSAAFDNNALYNLIATAVKQEPVFSMHIEECGDHSWLQLALLAEAAGDPDAHNHLVRAADRLTNGNFSKFYDGRTPFAIDDNIRGHLGHYTDADTGRRHDIRNVDFLAMLNWVGEQDMSAVHAFQDTYDRDDIPAPIRQADREKLLERVIGDQIRFTGNYRQITFHPATLTALVKAAQACGFTVRQDRMALDFTGGHQRGNQRVANYAMGNLAQGFQSNNTPFGNHQPMGVPLGGLW